MKILYDHQIFTTQKFGGISRYFLEIMKIGNDDFQMDRIDAALFPPPYSTPASPGLFSRGWRFAKRKIGIKEEATRPSLPAKVIETLKGGDFDVLHPTYYDPYFLEYLNKPFVLTVHDMIHEIYKEMFSLSDPTSKDKRLLCAKAKAILCVSHKTKADLIDILKIEEEKIHAIPSASDFDKVEARRPPLLDGIENFILFTGSRWSYKNFYFSVIALADVLKQDRSLQLLCTGHAFSNEELQFFKELGVETQVKHLFLNDDHELAWAYQNARVFIFPSLYEGFGFPLLEAFASDCPVVSSTGGSLSEVGGEGALFFDPKSILQIQDAVTRVLYDPEMRGKMIEKGRLQFAKYSWDSCRARTMEVYRSVFSNTSN